MGVYLVRWSIDPRLDQYFGFFFGRLLAPTPPLASAPSRSAAPPGRIARLLAKLASPSSRDIGRLLIPLFGFMAMMGVLLCHFLVLDVDLPLDLDDPTGDTPAAFSAPDTRPPPENVEPDRPGPPPSTMSRSPL